MFRDPLSMIERRWASLYKYLPKHSCLSLVSAKPLVQIHPPLIHSLFGMVQSFSSLQRSPRSAVTTLMVAGVGREAAATPAMQEIRKSFMFDKYDNSVIFMIRWEDYEWVITVFKIITIDSYGLLLGTMSVIVTWIGFGTQKMSRWLGQRGYSCGWLSELDRCESLYRGIRVHHRVIWNSSIFTTIISLPSCHVNEFYNVRRMFMVFRSSLLRHSEFAIKYFCMYCRDSRFIE